MAMETINLISDPPRSSLTSISRLSSTEEPTASPPPPSVKLPTYRPFKALPFELQEACHIYFEEALYTQAVQLLFSVLTSGTIPPSSLPAIAAPPYFLSFLSTLSTHPTFTTRAKSLERATTSSLSLRYLRVLLATVGPLQDIFCDALRWNVKGLSTRNGRKPRRKTTEEHQSDQASLQIENQLAQEDSLFHRADDIWHVVGWAFNCSILHRKRWEIWRAWLDFLLDLLESDWLLRSAQGQESLAQSMVVDFANGGKVGGATRRMLRAIFANGDGRAVNEFGEIWPNETKDLRLEQDSKKPEKKIDIEADDYGDYMTDEDDADLADTSSADSEAGKSTKRPSQRADNDELGGVDSLRLRLRFLSLLSNASAQVPQAFMSSQNLYDLFLDHIQALRPSTFYRLLSPSSLRYLDIAAASSITQYFLLTIISPDAPQPKNDHLTQDSLEAHYLPFAANATGAVDNAKVSICVETLLRLLDKEGELEGTGELLEAAEKGIKAREVRAQTRKGKRGSMTKNEHVVKQTWLDCSAARIRMVVRLAMQRTELDTNG